VIIFEGKSFRPNEFPEDDSYAKYLFWNFLHTHVVTRVGLFVVGKVAKGKEREK